VLLALGAALAYGASDFLGGLLSRRASPWLVAAGAQVASFVALLVVAMTVASDPTGADLWWGAASGIGSGAGTFFLYRGLGAGQMNVVAPLSAIGAALVPVAVGVLSGERPGTVAWLGIACAFPAIWLVSRGTQDASGSDATGPAAGATPEAEASGLGVGDGAREVPMPASDRTRWHVDAAPAVRSSAGMRDGLLAGAGFGLLFVALGEVPERAGLWPLAIGQAVAAGLLVAGALRAGIVLRSAPAAMLRGAGLVGILAATATTLYQLAARTQLVSVAAVLTSLYPALTVVLAAILLHERVSRVQAIGLALAGAAVVLVAVP